MISPKQIVSIVEYASPDRALLFIGPPRCGKSWAVKEGAKRRAAKRGKKFVEYAFRSDKLTPEVITDMLANPDKYYLFVDLRLSTKEPYDIEGRLEDAEVCSPEGICFEYTKQKAPLWAILLSVVEGVLFLDELLDVQRPDVKAASYQLLLDKQAGNVKFRDDVLIVAAGNGETSSLSTGLTLPQAGRLKIFHIRAPTVDEWVEFMEGVYKDGFDKSVIAYLQHYKDSLLKLPVENISGGDVSEQVYKSETYEAYPSPDAWTHLALALVRERELIDIIGLTEFVSAYIGPSEAMTFKQFYEEVIRVNIDELLTQPNKVRELDWNTKAAVLVQLASRLNEDATNLLKYKPLIDALVLKDKHSDFLVILRSLLSKAFPPNFNLEVFKKHVQNEKNYKLLETVVKDNRVPYNSVLLYILGSIDRRYMDLVSDICKAVMCIRRD